MMVDSMVVDQREQERAPIIYSFGIMPRSADGLLDESRLNAKHGLLTDALILVVSEPWLSKEKWQCEVGWLLLLLRKTHPKPGITNMANHETFSTMP